ncbi:c-type cytochrome [Mesorhizobium sp. M2D.F.Ca.ET.185.01.1.1]|uniref:c-type cytochrome n=1 Tax=unclassified Mesorhizobium TaxID=325217 RepID=UPI000FC9DE54|nr:MULTISPECIES: c-type cytochrome [unclassified Mesorhizobium]TGP55619.1 c-type cytochrome [bacterium M00.F.Ca.ET.230.01.1.1]TGP82777.1 c-type cytochrome [bacterium M00.F.Ca.ET.227.01.1.1]TGP94521.1 c-type cytochrome [bacterium M00.F.Ca.ET.221.01.1.1]TGP97974.1 c-type cytochrome [bacterium M00.F.Ca.ET.222.01.1.1]TGT96353.1 c-type cytochrome [bacterium M00.F.Ca.ET.163.01.1.1]TGU36043.1 c-type cytochrome [bacterium M00.F.Ca.ET.156.01.1.1]TGU48956.1 c-type cytochrome [bacterium M00.F.Ca.ET.146
MRPVVALLLSASLALAACQREERDTRPQSALGSGEQPIPVTTLEPGGQRPSPADNKAASFEANAFHLSEGKRLFGWFNCSGCHANGGGGMGPALMDEKWIYGSSMESIHATIRDGRPNGMPSFRDKIPDDQIWELAAFVRSLSGNAPSSAAPSRNDDMMVHPSENRMPDAATLGKSP